MPAELGVNDRGNLWARDHPNPNVEYEYFNANGSHYIRFIDGSATLEGNFPTVHYPAPHHQFPADGAAFTAEGQDDAAPPPAHD